MADDKTDIAKVVCWHTEEPTGLEEAIIRFKRDLPGWWYRVGECQVSADASCGPTRESEHVLLIPKNPRFDHGFDADLPMPASMADALDVVRAEALDAISQARQGEG